MIELISVYDAPEAEKVLYDLLLERTPEQSISHRSMPTYEQHQEFVRSRPYRAWYLARQNLIGEEPMDDAHRFIGSAYLTHDHEIGLFIFREHHGKGYGDRVLAEMRHWHPGNMLANISPHNAVSQRFFAKHGGKLIQCTYLIPAIRPSEEESCQEPKSQPSPTP